MKMYRFPRLLSSRPSRAIVEALILGVIVWLVLLIREYQHFPVLQRQGTSVLIGVVCIFVCALRLRVPSNTWQRQTLLIEVVIASVLSLALSVMVLANMFMLWGMNEKAIVIATLAFVLDYAEFVVLRIGIRIWLFWDRLRRTQLQWALTHAHVMVVALGAGLLIVLVEILIFHTARNFFIVVPTTVGLIVLSGIVLLAAIPPSALFSYIVIRHVTDRLKTLATATSILRDGDYAVRVPIEGEDEVAQLQADFNAMAADLERTMHELQSERDRVTGLLQSRRELIANVSHELRTPMATLRGYLESTLAHWDDHSQSALHHDLQVMENEVICLQRLVEDLFTLSRAEVGKLTLRCEPTDVGRIGHRVVETAAPLIWRTSKIELVAEIPSDLPLIVVDASRLEQVLQNLLHNATRHTSPGGIIAVVVLVKPEALMLQVKDTGEGIPPHDLPRIWERFYQSGSARMRTGTGLGLALVKEWVEAMGGTVSVESVVGEGSCFSIRLMRTC